MKYCSKEQIYLNTGLSLEVVPEENVNQSIEAVSSEIDLMTNTNFTTYNKILKLDGIARETELIFLHYPIIKINNLIMDDVLIPSTDYVVYDHKIKFINNVTTTQGYQNIVIDFDYGYNFIYDFSTISTDNIFDISNQDTKPISIFFKPDGLKMYILGQFNNLVHQYTLSTAWNVGTASYDNVSFSVAAKNILPQSLFFSPDGTKMYLLGDNNNSVYQYTLSIPWNVGTASYDNISFSVVIEDNSPRDVFFKPDGRKMYMVGNITDIIYEYTLSTPWDLSTMYYDNISFSVNSEDSKPESIFFKSDGLKMYLIGSDNSEVHQYTLSTAWDLGTTLYDNVSFSVVGQDTTPKSIFFKSNGLKMYMVGSDNDSVFQYILPTPWDLGTTSFDINYKNIITDDYIAKFVNRLAIQMASVLVLITQIGGTYDDVTSYNIPELSVSKGEPYTNIREALARTETNLKNIMKQVDKITNKVFF